MKTKKFKKDYIECSRCNKNTWDESDFWGCPRGSCEATYKGDIIIEKTLVLNKSSKDDQKLEWG